MKQISFFDDVFVDSFAGGGGAQHCQFDMEDLSSDGIHCHGTPKTT